MSFVTVYCTFADTDEAQRIGLAVVEEQLAACINILPACQSIYHWQGDIEQAAEVPAILKTSEEKAAALMERIAVLHSYEVPAIVAWPIVGIDASYGQWLAGSLGGEQKNG